MSRALSLASTHRPHPNPRVGAVVLSPDGVVVGEGAHQAPGLDHAEAVALAQAGERARGGTVVVTLEPCDHEGRTPPCSVALIAAGVARVVVGAIDPDPRVAGQGVIRLQAAGIDVETGLMAEDVELADPAYFHHRRTGRSRVTLKTAATLDGQAAAIDGSSQWITGLAARQDGHRLRAQADAVMIGAGTLIADDPTLDARLEGNDQAQPRPIVVAGNRELPSVARIWDRNPIVVTTKERGGPGEALVVPPGIDGLPDLEVSLSSLGRLGYLEILVEGGPTLAGGLWRAGLVDRGVFYLAGTVAGGLGLPAFSGVWPTLSAARSVEIVDVQRIGPDLRIEFLTHHPETTTRNS